MATLSGLSVCSSWCRFIYNATSLPFLFSSTVKLAWQTVLSRNTTSYIVAFCQCERRQSRICHRVERGGNILACILALDFVSFYSSFFFFFFLIYPDNYIRDPKFFLQMKIILD